MCYIYRTGTSDIIFGYNGRDGVVTDTNGLCYMRARYYSPDMRRFINADIIAGAAATSGAVGGVLGAILAAAPTAAEFIQQLGSMTPAFAH